MPPPLPLAPPPSAGSLFGGGMFGLVVIGARAIVRVRPRLWRNQRRRRGLRLDAAIIWHVPRCSHLYRRPKKTLRSGVGRAYGFLLWAG